MRALLDEGLPFRIAAYLRSEGHDVAICERDHPQPLDDRDILAIAVAEQRIVLTNDKDFGDLVFRDGLLHAGVILFRLGYVPNEVRIRHPQPVLTEHADALDRFFVVSPQGIRVA